MRSDYRLELTMRKVPVGPSAGNIALRFRAAACLILKVRAFSLQLIELNEDEFRPSSHVSICSAETTGTPSVFDRSYDCICPIQLWQIVFHVCFGHSVESLSQDR